MSISTTQVKNTATGSVQAIHSNIASPPQTRPIANPFAM
jgi:hypothetical protein